MAETLTPEEHQAAATRLKILLILKSELLSNFVEANNSTQLADFASINMQVSFPK